MKINPKKEVLDRIAEHHYGGVDPAASSAERAVVFYEMIRDMPSTSTRVVLGPVSTKTPDILTAVDEAEEQFVLKIRRPSDRVPYDIHRVEMEQERETCTLLALKAPRVALCPVEVIFITYEDRNYIALKMPRFLTTLQDNPRAFHTAIVSRGRKLVEAVHYMHGKCIVHMDIKSDIIFIGADKTWV